MLQNVKQFFDRHILPGGAEAGQGADHALQVATAALLVEAMRADGEIKEAEQSAVSDAIRKQFGLTTEDTKTLLRLAETEAEKATDYYRFTTLINDHFSAEQKEQMVEFLWRVVAADHEIDRFERTLVHKIGDLLYVPRFAQIEARDRAMRAVREGTK